MRKKKAELIEEIKSLQSENKMLHQRVYELAKLAEEVYRLKDENRRFKAYNEKLVKDLATATGQLDGLKRSISNRNFTGLPWYSRYRTSGVIGGVLAIAVAVVLLMLIAGVFDNSKTASASVSAVSSVSTFSVQSELETRRQAEMVTAVEDIQRLLVEAPQSLALGKALQRLCRNAVTAEEKQIAAAWVDYVFELTKDEHYNRKTHKWI